MDQKLCKDCKHAVLPGWHSYTTAMCAHPDAKRHVVYGTPMTSCLMARGESTEGATNLSICWPDAKLFEEKPVPEPVKEVPPDQQAVLHHAKPSWWRRLARKQLFGE